MPFSVPLQDLARELELDKWIGARAWPRARFFRGIDKVLGGLRAIHGQEPTDEQIVSVLAAMINTEEGLSTHCLDGGYGVDDERWKATCEAAAWMVVRRYRNAVGANRWKEGD